MNKASFPNVGKNKFKNCTVIAKYLWTLNENNLKYSVKWSSIGSVKIRPTMLVCVPYAI